MPERKCRGCTRQVEWGCTAFRWRQPEPGEIDGPENWVNPAWVPITEGEEDRFDCPRQDIRANPQDYDRLLMFYGMFRRGFLPDPGAIVDQSNVLLESLQLIDEASRECDEIEEAKARKREARAHAPPPRRR